MRPIEAHDDAAREPAEVEALRREVGRLRAETEATAARLLRVERELAETWALAEAEAAGRARAEDELDELRRRAIGEADGAAALPSRPTPSLPSAPPLPAPLGHPAVESPEAEGETFRRLREALGWPSQAEVGRQAGGVPQPYVSRYERGAPVPDWVRDALAAWQRRAGRRTSRRAAA